MIGLGTEDPVRISSWLALMLTPLGAQAATIVDPFQEPDEADAFQVEEQMVTVASRYAQTVRQAPSIVTVITDREIRERGYLSLADILSSLPGIYVTMAPEGRSLAWFRGVVSPDNNKILLLLDGVPIYDGIYTHAWTDEYVPLENVRQVEIIKGPGSAIYGTNAFAGVINIVTYEADDLEGGYVRAVAGSAARFGGAFVMGDRLRGPSGRQLALSGIVRLLNMDGDGLEINPKGERNITGTQPRRAVNASLGLRTDRLQLSATAIDYRHTYYTQPQDDALDVLLQSADEFNLSYRHQFFSARYRIEPSRNFSLTPHAYLQHYDDPGAYAWFSDPDIAEDEEGELSASWSSTLVETSKETLRWGGGLELQARTGASNLLVAGAGAEFNKILALADLTYVDLSPEPEEGFRIDPKQDDLLYDFFAYVQDTWTALYWLELTAGLRADYHSVSGFYPSPRAGVLLVPGSDTTIKLLYGSAFRAPNARELLVIVDQDEDGENKWTAGNQDLEHEKIHTAEAELLTTLGERLDLRTAAFYSSIRDEIDKRETQEPHEKWGDAYYDNFEDGSDVLGAEIEGTWNARRFELGASYAYTHATDRETGNDQYEFPPHMAHLRATLRLRDDLRASLLADGCGPRPRTQWSSLAGLDDGEPFVLLHAALATDLLANGRLRADLAVRNLMDAEYSTLIYRDDANELGDHGPKYPYDLSGAGRTLVVGIEGEF